MALTPTEEAQTRQLLDQLAALLSLATSEPTIISKLAATKVSLSDLSSVVTVNDTDLLLSRQGTDDKSVTVEKLKDFVKDSVSTVAFNDGTAASPSITNDGDLDTGFYFPAANTIGVTAAGVERLRFTTTGVGVNVATPAGAFDIAETVPTAGANGFYFKNLSDTTSNISMVRTSGSYSYNGVTGGVGQLYSSTSLALMADAVGGNNSILFSVGGAIRAQLQWDGKFGIGTTTPATTLDVNGDVTITDKIIHSGDTDTSIRFPAVDTVTVETGGVERMRVTSGGRIGVADASPPYKLSVIADPLVAAEDGIATRDAINRSVGIYRTGASFNTSGITGALGLIASGDSLAFIAGSLGGANPIIFSTGDTERVRIIGDGKVGIGTTSPSEQLHITGNFRIGSAVQATPTGSAPLYAARAWVNFNGTGTVAIRASGNVTSVTDNGTGDYTVNFTTAMPDENYSTVTASQWSTGAATNTTLSVSATNPPTSSAVRLINFNGNTGALSDPSYANVAIFR